VRDDVLGVDDLDVVRGLDVAGRDRAFAFLAQHQRDLVAVVQPEHHALEVEHDVDHVLLHAVDRRVLVQHAGDGHLGRRVADHRRQQHAAQGVAQRVAVAALERLERGLGAKPPSGSTWMALGLRRLVCIESVFLSIPSARYTDKADGPCRADRQTLRARRCEALKGCRRGRDRRTGVLFAQREYSSTISASLISAPNSSRSGLLEDAFHLGGIDLHPAARPMDFGQLQRVL
jgi:hypothetical protein